MNVLEMEKVLEQVQFGDWSFVVVGKPIHTTTSIDPTSMEEFKANCWPAYIQVKFDALDTATGQMKPWSGRKWQVSRYMTPTEVVMTAFKAVLTALEHEARETFTYKGFPIFGPHINIERLVEVYQGSNALDVREDIIEHENSMENKLRTEQPT